MKMVTKYVYEIQKKKGRNLSMKKGDRIIEDKYRGEEYVWIVTEQDGKTFRGTVTGTYVGEREVPVDTTTQTTLEKKVK